MRPDRKPLSIAPAMAARCQRCSELEEKIARLEAALRREAWHWEEPRVHEGRQMVRKGR